MEEMNWIEKLTTIKENTLKIYKSALSVDSKAAYDSAIEYVKNNAKAIINSEEVPDKKYLNNTSLLIAVADSPVKVIGKYAFSGCKNLTFFEGLENVSTIKNNAFAECENLRHIHLDSIEEIGNLAFKGCNNLLSFSLSNNLTNIDDAAFDEVELPLKEDQNGSYIPDQNGNPYVYISGKENAPICIGNTVRFIYKNAFKKDTDITTLTIPYTVKEIGLGAFSGCKSVETLNLQFVGANAEVMKGRYNTSLGDWYFGYIFGAPIYTQHESTVPSSIKEVIINKGDYLLASTFRSCKHIESVVLPETLKSIQTNAFRDCNFLGSTTDQTGTRIYNSTNPFIIPKNVEEIQAFAFYRCNYLQKILVSTENANFKSDSDGVLYTKNGEELIAFPPGYFYDYNRENAAHGKNVTGYTMSSGVKKIRTGAFNACRFMKRITIGKDVDEIDERAFEACSDLQRFVVDQNNEHFVAKDNVLYRKNEGALSLVVYPWAKITGVKSYTIDITTSVIENFAFQTPYLNYINIPKSVIAIDGNAFKGCSSLKAIYFECSESNAPEGSPWGAPSNVEIYYQSF